jgi:hypothetical protein
MLQLPRASGWTLQLLSGATPPESDDTGGTSADLQGFYAAVLRGYGTRTHVHGPLIRNAYAPDTSTVSGPSMLLSAMLLVSVLFSVAK